MICLRSFVRFEKKLNELFTIVHKFIVYFFIYSIYYHFYLIWYKYMWKWSYEYKLSFTHSNDFPTTSGAIQTTHMGNFEGFVLKFDFNPGMNITGFSVLKNGDSVNTIYSEYGSYIFRLDIVDTASVDDLDSVKSIIDPENNGGTVIRIMSMC